MAGAGGGADIAAVQPQARARLGPLELEEAGKDSALELLGGLAWPPPAFHIVAPSAKGE